MSAIVTLEDNLGSILSTVGNAPIGATTRPRPTLPPPSTQPRQTPTMPTMPVMPVTSQEAPQTVYALMPRTNGTCGCGSCSRCQQQSNWGGAPPTINVTVSPNITSNGGSAYSEGVRQVGVPMGEAALNLQPQPIVQTVEKPVFIDRVREVVKEIAVPVKQVVERIKQQPMFMPFQTRTPVDRPVPIPLKVPTPVDREVPLPVKYLQPVDRPVVVPVNPQTPQRGVRPPQPFQTVKNKRDDQTGINYFS